MTVYARPGSSDAAMTFESRYGNFIGGEWVPPAGGDYFENPTPVTGQPFCELPASTEVDIDKALDAAHGAAPAWGKTAPAERAVILNKIADRIEANLESLRWPRPGTTASPSARRSTPTFRWRSITSATSPARSARRRVR